MKFLVILVGFIAFALADVSHLANTYLPPNQYSAPSSSYLPPSSANSYESYSAQSYSAPAVQSYSAPAFQSYSAPAVQSYSAPAVQSYSAPSAEYLPPVSSQQSYSAPASFDVGTQYASNGGYVYRH